MHDPRIQELLNAYLKHELDFEEYRRLRTDYIDALNGTQRYIPSKPVDAEEEIEAQTAKAHSSFLHNQQLLLGVILSPLPINDSKYPQTQWAYVLLMLPLQLEL